MMCSASEEMSRSLNQTCFSRRMPNETVHLMAESTRSPRQVNFRRYSSALILHESSGRLESLGPVRVISLTLDGILVSSVLQSVGLSLCGNNPIAPTTRDLLPRIGYAPREGQQLSLYSGDVEGDSRPIW